MHKATTLKKQAKQSRNTVLIHNGGGDWPALGFSGNKKATISIDALYVDNTYVNMFENNAPITVICGPLGSSGGNPKDTYSTIVTDVETVVKHENVTALKISLEVIAKPTHGTW